VWQVPATLLGSGLCRGAKMYLDVKDSASREFSADVPHRVNPAIVLTGDERDANLYSIYLVDERACLSALLGEPRFLAMAPDALRIDLDDPLTSRGVVDYAASHDALGRGCSVSADSFEHRATTCAVMAVIAVFKAPSFVAAPPFEVRPDGTRVTGFRASLALFAGCAVDAEPSAWNAAVAAKLAETRAKLESTDCVDGRSSAVSSLYATTKPSSHGCFVRLSSSTLSKDDARGRLDGVPIPPHLAEDPKPTLCQITAARPHAFPIDGPIRKGGATALLIIDVQRDFSEEGGYLTAMGYDVAPFAEPIARIAAVLDAARRFGLFVVHTRQGFRPDLADCPEFLKQKFRDLAGFEIGVSVGPLGKVLVRGEPGWEINPKVAPIAGEPIIDKTPNDAFLDTDLDTVLFVRRVEHLIVCGHTLDCCVHSTLRHARDRNYQTLLIEDCCGCCSPSLRAGMIESVQVEDGIFGCVATSNDVLRALGAASSEAS